MKKAVEIVQYLQLLSSFMVVATYPLSDTSPLFRIAMVAFMATYILDVILTQRYVGMTLDNKRIYFFGVLLLFLLGFAYLPFSSTTEWFKPMMEYRLPLLIFSIVGLFGLNSKHRFSYFVYVLPVLACIYSLYVFGGIDLEEFFSTASGDRTELFRVARVLRINQHMRYNFFMNMGLLSAIWIFISYKPTKFVGAVYVLLSIPPAYTLLITEGRSGFLAFIMLVIFLILYYTIKTHKWFLLSLYMCLFLAAITYALSTKWRLAPDQVKAEPRLFLWQDVALPLIAESPIFGYGVSDAQSETLRLKNEKLPPELETLWTPEDRVDVHNQYLQTYLEFGIIGEALLLFIYLFPVFMVIKERRAYMIGFVMLSMWQSVYDLFIVGQFGVIFCFTVILILLPAKSQPKQFMGCIFS